MKNNHIIQNGDAMSGNEPTGARRRGKTKVAAWIGVAGICATGASLIPVGNHTQAAFGDPMSEGMLCTNGTEAAGVRTFDLVADDGYISQPDGNAVYSWGYGESDSGFQYPGPVLCANQGETIIVNLHNNLPVATSITFPGQTGVMADGSLDGPQVGVGNSLVALAKEAGATGGDVQYSFVAEAEGTYLYESGSDPQLQVEMGLFGALVVRPSGISITYQDILGIPWADGDAPDQTNADAGMTQAQAEEFAAHATCAYASLQTPGKCDPLAIYDNAADRENILMLSQVDPGMHAFMEAN